MNEAVWKQEMLWVARNEHSIIVRVAETPPDSWLESLENENSQKQPEK